MKYITAILFSVLLAGMQIAPLPVAASELPACCTTPAVDNGADCCGPDGCCVAHPTPDSKTAPAVPSPSGVQNDISLLAPAVVFWTLPENPTITVSPVSTSSLMSMSAPLYARDCALLL